jgi:hypothetical protein
MFFFKKKKERKNRERETPADLYIGGMIGFSISHL